MWDGNGPYFRAKVIVLGTAAIVIGLLVCVFAILQVVDASASGDYGSPVMILVAGISLVALAAFLVKRSD